MTEETSILGYVADIARRINQRIERGKQNWLEANRQKQAINARKKNEREAEELVNKESARIRRETIKEGQEVYKEKNGDYPSRNSWSNETKQQFENRVISYVLEERKANEKRIIEDQENDYKYSAERHNMRPSEAREIERLNQEAAKNAKMEEQRQHQIELNEWREREEINKKREQERVDYEKQWNEEQKELKKVAEAKRQQEQEKTDNYIRTTANKIVELNQLKNTIDQELAKEISKIDENELSKSIEAYYKLNGYPKKDEDYDYRDVRSKIQSKRSFLEGIKDDRKKLLVAKTLHRIESDVAESKYLKEEVKKYQKIAIDKELAKEISEINIVELKKSFETYYEFCKLDDESDPKAVSSQIQNKRSFLEGINDDRKKLWVAKILRDIEGDGPESRYLKQEVKDYQEKAIYEEIKKEELESVKLGKELSYIDKRKLELSLEEYYQHNISDDDSQVKSNFLEGINDDRKKLWVVKTLLEIEGDTPECGYLKEEVKKYQKIVFKATIDQELKKEISEIDKGKLKESFEAYYKLREEDDKISLDYDSGDVSSRILNKTSFLEGIKDDRKKLLVAKTLLDIEGDGPESGYLKQEVKKYQKIVDQKNESAIGDIRYKLKEVVGKSDKASKLELYKDDKRSDEEKEFEVTKFFLQASHQRKEYRDLGLGQSEKVERIKNVLEARFNEKKSDKDQEEVKELFKVLKKFDPKIQSDLLDSPPRGKLAFFKKLFGLKEEIKLSPIEDEEITKFSASDYKKLDRVEADNTPPPAPAQPAQTPPTPSHEATNTKPPAPAEPDQTPPTPLHEATNTKPPAPAEPDQTPPTPLHEATNTTPPAPAQPAQLSPIAQPNHTQAYDPNYSDSAASKKIKEHLLKIEKEKIESEETFKVIISKIENGESDDKIKEEISKFFKICTLKKGVVTDLLRHDFQDIEKNKKLTVLARQAFNEVSDSYKKYIPEDPEKLLKQREEGFSPPPPPPPSLSPRPQPQPSTSARPQPQPSTSAPPQTQHLDPFGIQGLGGVIDSLCKPMIGGGFFGLSVDSGKPGSSQNSGNKR